MSKSHSNPPTIHRPNNDAYSHTVLVEGGRLLFISGQVGLDADGTIVGRDDLATQARQAFRNLRSALEAHGASPADLVKLTTFVVGDAHRHLAVLASARTEILEPEVPPASTLVGVQSLAIDGLLVEVEAVALLD